MSIDRDAWTDHRHWLRNEYEPPVMSGVDVEDEDDLDAGYTPAELSVIEAFRAEHPDRIVIGITADDRVLSVPSLTAADIDQFVRTGRLEGEAVA